MGTAVSINLNVVLSIKKNQKTLVEKKYCSQEKCGKYLLETTAKFCPNCGSEIKEHSFSVVVDEDLFLKIKEEDEEDRYCELILIEKNDENDKELLLIYDQNSKIKRKNNCCDLLEIESYAMRLPSKSEQEEVIEYFKNKNSSFLNLLESKKIKYELSVQIVGAC